VILGPTGTGKSAVAVAVAERIGGEIVGCDALQVYRGFDAATAKPSRAERERVRHHMIDEVDPSVDYTLADWVRGAERAIADVAERGRTPIVAGGTGMYLRGLLLGVIDAPPRRPELRLRLSRLSERRGTARLHRWLVRLDPRSAARIAPGDGQRIVRALELALTGEPWGERLARDGTWAGGAERYPAAKFGLDLDRELLGRRLAERVDSFFDRGLVAEAQRLLAGGVPPRANAWKAIGYREVLAAILRGEDPEATRELVVRATRRFAKRQRTWFRSEAGVTWLDAVLGPDALAEAIVERWRGTVAP
jgi:tRNA dimethylallyltransferase